MSFDEVLSAVNQVFIDVLDHDDIRLTPASTAADVEDWDSLTHIELVVAIEKRFGVKFTLAEIQGYRNVGEMCEGIVRKLGAR
jgi:acyl carrier protein